MRRDAVWFLVLALAVGAGGRSGAETGARTAPFKAVNLPDVQWKDAPIPCTKTAILAGDPKQGMHQGYLKMSDGCHIPPHWHTADEYITVVSGTVLFGVGEKADRALAKEYGPGAFLLVPARTPHYGWAVGECILSQVRTGAVDFNWVNPADDPTRKPAPHGRVEESRTGKGDGTK